MSETDPVVLVQVRRRIAQEASPARNILAFVRDPGRLLA
jgi:hypothetical protein